MKLKHPQKQQWGLQIKVGTTTLEQLNVNKELDIDVTNTTKDNPDYVSENSENEEDDLLKKKKLDVYDVLLAGVETDDR